MKLNHLEYPKGPLGVPAPHFESHWLTVCVSVETYAASEWIKKEVYSCFLPFQSNSSSCFDEQHACAAWAGRRCRRSSVGKKCLYCFSLWARLPHPQSLQAGQTPASRRFGGFKTSSWFYIQHHHCCCNYGFYHCWFVLELLLFCFYFLWEHCLYSTCVLLCCVWVGDSLLTSDTQGPGRLVLLI